MAKLKSIEFGFENVTGAKVCSNLINNLKITTQNKSAISFNGQNKVEMTNKVEVISFSVSLSSESNVHYKEYGQDSQYPLFERLKAWSDIVDVTLVYDDDSEEFFIMPWNSKTIDDIENTYQSYIEEPNGALTINIQKELP